MTTIKERAFLWLKLELAYKLYWTQEDDGNSYLWEDRVSVLRDGKIRRIGETFSRYKFINGNTKENIYKQDEDIEKRIEESNQYDLDALNKTLEGYELPEDKIDILTLMMM